jgi:hypothetical protein
MEEIKSIQFAEILKYCVKNDTREFTSRQFYEITGCKIHSTTTQMENIGLIKKVQGQTYAIKYYYSFLKYLGMIIRRYYKIAHSNLRIEIFKSVEDIGLQKELLKFFLDFPQDDNALLFCLSGKDMEETECNYLLDYFDICLAKQCIRRDIKVPFAEYFEDE